MDVESRKVIVIAGGTGGIGRHIVDGIVAAKKYTVKVFSRQDPSSLVDMTVKGVIVVKVDYSDRDLLVKELQGVHTVIVTLISLDDSCVQAQINLLNAALKAKVKRIAPSEWTGQHDENTVIELYRRLKVPVREKIKAAGIEYTVFMIGLLMDYFASPQTASKSIGSLVIGVDFSKCVASITGSGDEPFCLTRADDVGKFVAAALELDKWNENSGIVGSRTTWNEIIKLGEKIRGTKFHVQYTCADEAARLIDTMTDNVLEKLIQQVYLGIVRGEFDFEATLNNICPEIKPTTIEQFLMESWADYKG
ncbi:unnamed protein product [Adineta ricciae]|uniref:NmrA-like domain-containing protein n=2 Tax=Adineta ricciae TaxID=249248 RepID=A0A815PA33_ADIRI|nr:unnamed protein product [Adineta ricciae]